jgi:6-phosphogluconolactonase
MFALSRAKTAAALSLGLLLFACSSQEGDADGSGSATGDGGNVATGGAPAGGASDSGGAPQNSGGTGAGGSSTGGTENGSGGNPDGVGGADAAGGQVGTGGETASGGASGEADLKTYVYVASGDWSPADGGLVTVYEMNREQKTLEFISEHPAGGLPSFVAIDQGRRRLFAADESNGGVISFSIDEATGQLTSLGATPHTNNPVYLSLSPDGTSLLAANYNQGSVDVYPIGSDGKAQAPSQTEATGSQAHCIVIDQNNRVLVANKGEGTISHFTFESGALSSASPTTTALASPRHIFHAADERAYVVSEEADLITAFDVDSNGALTVAWQEARLPPGGSPVSDTGADIEVTPSGKFLYATNRGGSNTVVAYDLQGATPQLIEHEPTQGVTPRSLAIDPLEEFLIVANHGSTMSVVTFAIAADGSLELAEVLPATSPAYFVGIAQF